MSNIWKTVWTGSVQGPYPSGNPFAQPELSFAFPEPAIGARDQTFRLLVRPDRWGGRARLRFANTFGERPLILDNVYAGLHLSGGNVVGKTGQPVRFGDAPDVVIAPGDSIWSDAFRLPFVDAAGDGMLYGRKLAVSFHVADFSGPMTWHAKAMTTSYVSPPGAGSHGEEEGEEAFPFAVTSWFFLNAVDMEVPGDCKLVVAFGDSLTDGTNSTLNGDDRWPDIFSRRARRLSDHPLIVINAGIGGNHVVWPDSYPPEAGGPSAVQRIERDVLALTGVDVLFWLQGINDFRHSFITMEQVWEGMTSAAALARLKVPGIRLIAATVPTCFGSALTDHGGREQDDKRRRFNERVREGGIFDAWVDFDTAISAPGGGLRPEFACGTMGGPGDGLHPGRAGYLAMALSVAQNWTAKPRNGSRNEDMRSRGTSI